MASNVVGPVRPFVHPSVRDVEVSWPYRLELALDRAITKPYFLIFAAFEVSVTLNLAQRSSRSYVYDFI